jgi:hypothetical protein
VSNEEKMELCLKSLPSLIFWKRCIGNPNILLDIFTYIFLCSCSYRKWTHKHNNLKYVSKLCQSHFFILSLSSLFFLCLYALNFYRVLKYCTFLRFFGARLRQENLLEPLFKLSSSKLSSCKRGWGKTICVWSPTFNTKNWRLSAKRFALARLGASKLWAQKFREGPMQKTLHLASNFWHQKVEINRKEIVSSKCGSFWT